MIYEIRDDPDDLPIPCTTLEDAKRRARQRAMLIGGPVLIYEIDDRYGEKYLGAVE